MPWFFVNFVDFNDSLLSSMTINMNSRNLCTEVSLGLWEGPDRCVKTCRSSHRLRPSDKHCSHLNWSQCTQCRVGLLRCASTPYRVPGVVQLVLLSICLLLVRLSIHPFFHSRRRSVEYISPGTRPRQTLLSSWHPY